LLLTARQRMAGAMTGHHWQMIRRGLLVLAGLVILAGSLAPSGDAPGLLPDKVRHFLAYGGWAAVAVLSPRPWRRILIYLLLIFLFGAAVEVLQPHFGRTGSLADIVANTLGMLTGAALGRAVWRVYRRRRRHD